MSYSHLLQFLDSIFQGLSRGESDNTIFVRADFGDADIGVTTTVLSDFGEATGVKTTVCSDFGEVASNLLLISALLPSMRLNLEAGEGVRSKSASLAAAGDLPSVGVLMTFRGRFACVDVMEVATNSASLPSDSVSSVLP